MKQRVSPIALNMLALCFATTASAQTTSTIMLGSGATRVTVPVIRAAAPPARVEAPTTQRSTVIRESGRTLICPPGDLPCIGPFPLQRVYINTPWYSQYWYTNGYYFGSGTVRSSTLTRFPTSPISTTSRAPAANASRSISVGGVLFSTRRYSTKQYGVMGPHQRPARRTPRNLLR